MHRNPIVLAIINHERPDTFCADDFDGLGKGLLVGSKLVVPHHAVPVLIDYLNVLTSDEYRTSPVTQMRLFAEREHCNFNRAELLVAFSQLV